MSPDQLKRLQENDDDPFNKLLGTNQLLDAGKYDLSQEDVQESEKSEAIKDIDNSYKNDAYYALPANVRNALDIAQ